jgi:bifunctional non-homologous end joining protein LigD
MHVEDHPVAYGDFEGVIPEGYGAGIVMLWDRGTWTPEQDDVDAALKKGDLKFTLEGYKLKGSWVLVKTSGRFYGAREGGEGRSWLLIKHRDDWSGDVDIAEFAPRSVKSDGDFEDILAEDNPAIWHSNRPAKGGDTGKMFESIIERAAAIKAGRKPGAKVAKVKPGRAATSAAPAAATKKAASEKTAARKTGARKTAGKSRTSK